jgi:hypothetical protein
VIVDSRDAQAPDEGKGVDPIVVLVPRARFGCLAFGAFLFVALGAVMLAMLDDCARRASAPQWAIVAVCLASILFFGACLVAFVRKLASKEPLLVVDREGIVDRVSGIAAGRIPWEEIEDLRIRTVLSQRFLEICVRDPRALIARQPAFRRLMMHLNRWFSMGPVCLPETALPMRLEDLRDAILRFLDPGPSEADSTLPDHA